MLKIVYYDNESKMSSGYDSCCAYIDTDDFDGYTSLDSIEPRCSTYKEAKEELLRHVVRLRDELNDFIERETVENDCFKGDDCIKNTEERDVINSLITIKEYCYKNDTAGKCFCCLMYGLCNKCFKGLPSLWDINNPYKNKE